MNYDKTISLILIILLIIAVTATIYIIVNPNPGEKFTEFYILGTGDKAGNYPTNLSVDDVRNITIGIVNHEHSTTTYNMVITLDGTTIKSENYTLVNNETKEINYPFKATYPSNNQKLEFKLYKLPDNNTVYRTVFLNINVQSNE
jgi:uncharacterized membrane protein